jgi:hypothetical protein
MSVGRNDPCPCGSGKKFKRCCDAPPLPRDLTVDDILYKRLRLQIGEHRNSMRRFVDREYGIEFLDVAWQVYCSPGVELEVDLPIDFDPATPFANLFLRWFEHHWKPDPDDDVELDADILAQPPTGVYLSRNTATIDPLLRSYLESCMATRAEFFEVIAVDRDRGITVRNLTGGPEIFVHHQDVSRAVTLHQVLYAHIVPLDSINLAEALPPLALHPNARENLTARVFALAKDDGRNRADSFVTRDTELRELFLEYLADQIESEANQAPES